KARRDEACGDETGRARRDQARRDEARRDQARRDQAGRDQGRRRQDEDARQEKGRQEDRQEEDRQEDSGQGQVVGRSARDRHLMKHALLIALALSISVGSVARADDGDKGDAKSLLSSGLKLFAAKDYLGALSVFE